MRHIKIIFTLLCLVSLSTQLSGATPRPTIYVYTDFGGGQSEVDTQTSLELAGLAWKLGKQHELLLNDGAIPLRPDLAANALAATFPYRKEDAGRSLHSIVVHVIDPGVGTQGDSSETHPRALALRKDGVLFIGPDNGTLSHVCPDGSLESIWEIDAQKVCAFTGADLSSGQTFHGRDLFLSAAVLVGSGHASLEELGLRYPGTQLRHCKSIAQSKFRPITFTNVRGDRFYLPATGSHPDLLFETAYLLGIGQCPHYNKGAGAKTLFVVETIDDGISIVNKKTGNVYIGPNNGLGTAFFVGYHPDDIHVTPVSKRLRNELLQEDDNAIVVRRLLALPALRNYSRELDLHAAHSVTGKAWIDAYGNIKTTIDASILNQHRGPIKVTLNQVTHHVVAASSFRDVAPGELFVYSGSSAVVGPNPHRSRRYLEISTNAINGVFGADHFVHQGIRSHSGQAITLNFNQETY